MINLVTMKSKLEYKINWWWQELVHQNTNFLIKQKWQHLQLLQITAVNVALSSKQNCQLKFRKTRLRKSEIKKKIWSASQFRKSTFINFKCQRQANTNQNEICNLCSAHLNGQCSRCVSLLHPNEHVWNSCSPANENTLSKQNHVPGSGSLPPERLCFED